MENRNFTWSPVSKYTGGRVLATNGLDVLIGEINSEGDCESEEDGSTVLCGITGFIKIEEILPKSEDERVRKAIINVFASHKDYEVFFGASVKDILAWLEKQGEQKQKIQPKFKIGDTIRFKGNETLKGEAEVHKIVSYDNELYVFADGTTDLFCEQDLYELVEQKPNDKVEPKFHKGEWITNGDYIWKIVEVKPLDYILQSQDGNIVDDTISHVDEQFHSFNIQDARDGDVLYLQKDGKEHIIIYKGVIKERFRTFVSAYCAYNGIVDAFCFADVSRYIDIAYGGIMPATKEQRDLLEKVMADAGYTFDFEKKELKKIEQKPAENKGMNLVEEEMTPFQKKVFCIIDTTIEEEQGLKQVCDELFALASNEIKQNPAWSEDDELHVNSLLKRLEGLCRKEFAMTRFAINEDEDWLRSLKDRVQPQPKQEWNEEDRYMLNNVIDTLRPLSETTHSGYAINSMIKWLKSLRSQTTWKPSEEQIEALLKLEEMHVLEHEKNQENAHLYMVVKSIREQLLKLRKG